jgi:hypothetical protein
MSAGIPPRPTTDHDEPRQADDIVLMVTDRSEPTGWLTGSLIVGAFLETTCTDPPHRGGPDPSRQRRTRGLISLGSGLASRTDRLWAVNFAHRPGGANPVMGKMNREQTHATQEPIWMEPPSG